MFALIIHDSDEVKDCFIGETKEEILNKINKSKYWEDITSRITEATDGEMPEEEITVDTLDTELYHDGDSEDGYTLLKAK